jgi:hypothetical protein
MSITGVDLEGGGESRPTIHDCLLKDSLRMIRRKESGTLDSV